MFLNFIDEPKDSRRRTEREKGIYQDYLIEHEDGFKVHIILLDLRFDFDRKANLRMD